MTLTIEDVTALPADALVTLTHRPDGGPEQVLHLRAASIRHAVVHEDALGRPSLEWGVPQDEPGAALWADFRPIWGSDWHPSPQWAEDWDALFARSGVCVRLGAPAWTVEPLGEAGRAWMTANEPADAARDRLLARVRAADPALARDLMAVIDRLVDAARWEGESNARAF